MMKKSLKPVIITSAAAVFLGGVLAVILLVPDKNSGNSESGSSFSPVDFLEEDDLQYPITAGSRKDLLSVTVKRADGELIITRENSDAEFSHKLSGLGKVEQNNVRVTYLLDNLAALIAVRLVEDNLVDLSKYGLDSPVAKVFLDFEEGQDIEITFGGRSPTDDKLIYCMANGFVFLVSYNQIEDIFSQPKDLAELTLISDTTEKPENITIVRSDFAEPITLSSVNYAQADGEQTEESTAYRLTSPYSLPLNADKGKRLYTKLIPLTADSCEYVEKTEETLAQCGFDNPTATVTFTSDGVEYKLTIGKMLSDGSGWYAMMSDKEGIYSVKGKNALWADFTLAEVVGMTPFSLHISACKTVEVTTSSERYVFENKQNKFYLNGNTTDDSKFRELFENLSQITCDEFYTGEINGVAALKVRFTYNSDYQALYNKSFDEYSLFADNGRKYIMTINGNTVYKVNAVYVQRIYDKLSSMTK